MAYGTTKNSSRKEKLNKLFPYAKPLCLTEDEFNTLDTYFKQNTNTLTSDEQTSLIAINNRVLNQKLTFSTCSSCLRDLVSKLRVDAEQMIYEIQRLQGIIEDSL